MADQTDRQRAEAEARSFAPMKPPSEQWVSDVADMFMDFRREGWEAGREEAATVLRQEGYSAAASRIRALKPKE